MPPPIQNDFDSDKTRQKKSEFSLWTKKIFTFEVKDRMSAPVRDCVHKI